VGTGELPTVLGGNHAATIVYAACNQGIAGVEIVLQFDVDDNGDLFLGTGKGGPGAGAKQAVYAPGEEGPAGR